SLFAGNNFFAGLKLAGDPEGFEVRHGATAAEVPEGIAPAEHRGDFGDGFFLHGGGGATTVERVIVGIDEYGQRIGGARERVRGLEHLSSIERMEIRIVIVEARGGGV